ncbi:MAG: SHOCT domain-containing protein [bacterium]
MMFGIWILWIALIVLIVWGVKVFIDYTDSKGKIMKKGKSALDILRERFARGEIDKQEFEERKKMLTH